MTVRLTLPPLYASMPRARREQLEQFFAFALSISVEVTVADNYDRLTRQLMSGEADIGWAPPWACARLETVGIPVLLRAIRKGSATYRAALVCNTGTRRLDLQSLRGSKAAWVDRESCAGYLLPGAYLRGCGLDPDHTFGAQVFLGSYERALSAVVCGEADISSVYCSSSDTTPDLERVAPGLARRLRVLALTDEVPNDGIAIGRFARADLGREVEHVLMHPDCVPNGRYVLESVFGTTSFEAAPRHGYRALYALLSGRSDRIAV